MTIDTGLNDKVLDVLRVATGRPDLAYSGQPSRLTGGFWAELLAFSLTDPPAGWPSELVARVMPDPLAARKETIVQGAMAAAGFPTPAVRLAGGPDDGLGRAFMIMDLAEGSALLPGLDGAGAVVAALRQASRLPEVLASTMASLHALDPRPVRDLLAGLASEMPVTLTGTLDLLESAAAGCRRPDLAAAARWLADHRRPPAPDVICHGDLHPFNLLSGGGRVTVVDWSAALLAPRAYDVAFTTLMLSEPPLALPGALRPGLRRAGRALAHRFGRRYAAHAGVTVGREDLRWHQALVCLRALVEAAGWAHDGITDERAGHPWLISGRAFAAHLTSVTGVDMQPIGCLI